MTLERTLFAASDSDLLVCKLEIPGRAEPKGNMRAQGFSVGRLVRTKLYDSNKNLPRWTRLVRGCAHGAMRGELPVQCPVRVCCVFGFVRPKGHHTPKGALSASGRRQPYPTARSVGDIDKLARGLLDGLTGIVWLDDQQVVELHAFKDWTSANRTLVTVERVES